MVYFSIFYWNWDIFYKQLWKERIMRRLAWLTWDTNVYSDMTVDDAWDYSWKRWREYIVSKAEDLSWSDSQTIIDEYG